MSVTHNEAEESLRFIADQLTTLQAENLVLREKARRLDALEAKYKERVNDARIANEQINIMASKIAALEEENKLLKAAATAAAATTTTTTTAAAAAATPAATTTDPAVKAEDQYTMIKQEEETELNVKQENVDGIKVKHEELYYDQK